MRFDPLVTCPGRDGDGCNSLIDPRNSTVCRYCRKTTPPERLVRELASQAEAERRAYADAARRHARRRAAA